MSASDRIGPLHATAIVAGNMIGSGVFLLPAVLASVGSSSLIGWGLAAAGAVVLALVCAVAAKTRPESETLTDYPSTAFHPALGFVSWLAYWLGNVVGNVAIVLVAVGYGATALGLDLSPGAQLAALIAGIWLLAAAVYAGPSFVAWLASATLLIGLAPIVTAIVVGAVNFDVGLFAESWNVSGKPVAAATPPIVLTIFWAFLGLESANAIAARVKDPARNVAFAAVGGVLVAALIYAGAAAALFGLLPAAALAASNAPFADAIGAALGAGAAVAVAAAAFARTAGCAAGWLLVTVETGRAGARSGFLPRFVTSGENARPARDVIFMASVMSLAALATVAPSLAEQFKAIADFSVYMFLLVYGLTSLALMRFAGALPVRWRLPARLLGAVGAAVAGTVAGAAAFAS